MRKISLLSLAALSLAALARPVPVLAQSPDEALWLKTHFEGGFDWQTRDPQSGDLISGRGECEMRFNDQYLHCTHLSPAGEPMGVGVSSYNTTAQRYEWVFYGGGGNAISFGAGQRDAENGLSWVEGRQILADGTETRFRTETEKREGLGWRYTYYLADGEGWMPVYDATFVYDSERE